MPEKKDARLIVSMTSYPERIRFVPAVLDSLKKQIRKPDEILLYLSRENFPGLEADLPPMFRGLIQDHEVTVRWTEGDLKPHKKYFDAFQEFRGDYVVTVDDDTAYAPDLLERLWRTHERFPDAVIAGRTHLITLDSEGKIRPYNEWIHRTMGLEDSPSMQLMAVGVGGVLYDPELFPEQLLDREAILETCPEADDLWLKAMEAAAGIPVVRAPVSDIVPALPGSQINALYKKNRNQGANDSVLEAVVRRLEGTFGENFLAKAILQSPYPVIRGEDSLLAYINSDKGRYCSAIEEQGGSDEAARQTIAELRAEVERMTGLREHERQMNLEKNAEIERMREKHEDLREQIRNKSTEMRNKVTEMREQINEERRQHKEERHKLLQENNMLHYCLDHPILSRIDKTRKTLFPNMRRPKWMKRKDSSLRSE